MKIGVTGATGAGKTTFVRYLGSKGFEHVSLSDLIRNELALRNMELTRANLQQVGNQMRQESGLGIWAQKALEIMQPGRDYVIDSIRNPGEIKALADSGDFILFAVTAPLDARFARVAQRPGRDEKDPVTFAAFKRSEASETGSGMAHRQQLDECARLAQVKISNNSDMAAFFALIDKELECFRAKLRNLEI